MFEGRKSDICPVAMRLQEQILNGWGGVKLLKGSYAGYGDTKYKYGYHIPHVGISVTAIDKSRRNTVNPWELNIWVMGAPDDHKVERVCDLIRDVVKYGTTFQGNNGPVYLYRGLLGKLSDKKMRKIEMAGFNIAKTEAFPDNLTEGTKGIFMSSGGLAQDGRSLVHFYVDNHDVSLAFDMLPERKEGENHFAIAGTDKKVIDETIAALDKQYSPWFGKVFR
jgi:hypothetical protein